jgi:hypothetical protein
MAEGQRSPKAARRRCLCSRGAGGGGLSQEADGEATGHRGSRAAADGGHKKECPSLCSGPTAAALPLLHAHGPVPGVVVPGRGKGVGAEGGGSPRRCGSGPPGQGRRQTNKGGLSRERPGESGDPLVTGARREDKGAQGVHPHDGRHDRMLVNTLVGLSRSFPPVPGPGGCGHGAGCRHSRRETLGRVGSGRCPGRQVTGVRFQPDWRLPASGKDKAVAFGYHDLKWGY